MYIMETNKFKCIVCNKYYKSYKSLWNHKKKYHDIIPANIPNISPDIPNISPHIPNISPEINNDNQLNIKKINKRNCDYCNKILSSYKNLHRHQQKCKLKDNEQDKKEMKKEIAELREIVAELIKNKLNNTNSNNTNNNTNSNNTTNNNNNGTINNNYITVVPFGKENFVQVTTEKEHLFILKQDGNNVLYKCVEMKHFNEDLPQFHNYIRLNNRTDDAKIYDENVGDFKTVDKNEIIDTVIDNAELDIDEMYNLHKNKINTKQKENVRRIVDKPYSKETEQRINLMAYDYRNMVINTHKKNKKHKSIT